MRKNKASKERPGVFAMNGQQRTGGEVYAGHQTVNHERRRIGDVPSRQDLERDSGSGGQRGLLENEGGCKMCRGR